MEESFLSHPFSLGYAVYFLHYNKNTKTVTDTLPPFFKFPPSPQGYVTLVQNDYPVFKYLLIGLLAICGYTYFQSYTYLQTLKCLFFHQDFVLLKMF